MFDQFHISEDEIIAIFAPFSTDGWASLNTLESKREALQRVVDLYSRRFFGIDRLCAIDVVPFVGTNCARYEPSINTILLREEMVQDGCMKYKATTGEQEKTITYAHPAKHAFFYTIHELRHAMQRYWINHPETCPQGVDLRIIKANQSHRDLRTSQYIKSEADSFHKINIASLSRLYALYLLQPIERDAWKFAHREVADWEKIMAELFPKDAAFQVETKYSSFEENMTKAYAVFKTEAPDKDIDNIFLAIDGENIDQELNKVMCKTWTDTQNEYMCQKIENARDAVNERVRKRVLLEEQEQQNINSLFEEIDR